MCDWNNTKGESLVASPFSVENLISARVEKNIRQRKYVVMPIYACLHIFLDIRIRLSNLKMSLYECQEQLTTKICSEICDRKNDKGEVLVTSPLLF